MISRLYAPFAPLTKRVGIHSHLKSIYHQPAEHIEIYNRSTLRGAADTLYSYSSSETVKIPPLSTVVNDFTQYQRIKDIDGVHEFNQPFVAEINNGHIIKRSGFSATDNYRIILDSADSRETRVRAYYGSNIMDSIHLLYRQTLSDTEHLDTYDVDIAVPLIRTPRPNGTRQDNYSHWLQGYLTRLEGIEFYQELTGNNPKIIIEKDPPTWILESLELLGYGENIHFWDPTDEIQVKRLVVPSVRRIEEWQRQKGVNYKVPSKQACEWLHNNAIQRVNIPESKFSKKVFISRADAARRRIRNRGELVEDLRELGFESYELTKLSFQEQVALFAQAEEIVGVHGAGLANIMFASDCRVTEIVGGSFKPTYYIMAEILDLEYRLVSGQSVDDPELSIHDQDIKIYPSIFQ